MILGALLDVGVPLDDLRAALGSLAVAPDLVWTERVTRAGIAATKFCVRGEDLDGVSDDRETPDEWHVHGRHGHTHRHHGSHAHTHTDTHPAHRTLTEVESLIDQSGLSTTGKARARHLFHRLASAEAAVHGVPLDQVHLHEVGALDSIIDVVGTVWAIESLGIDRVVSSALNVGSGTIRSAHGVYPVPAPATLELLRGAPVYAGRQQVELVTPTGALLLTEYATEFGAMPPMRPRKIGYGAGSRDFVDAPNVLRVVLGDADAAAAAHTVVVLEAEIDDMNPQLFGVLMDRLLAAGALDVFYTPIQMKKNRPGTLLTVICTPPVRAGLVAVIFRESTTIGVRFREMQRECLDRETVVVETPLGAVRMKVARRDGAIMNYAPEFDDCVRLAGQHGRPVKEVQALALKMFLER